MIPFAHLHLHTEYSLLDGACRIKNLMQHIKKLGQTSVAITDHGVMYGVVDFYKAAKEEGIKPIIGCEVYVAPRSRFDKEYGPDSKSYHLILLCETQEGYHNLMKLVSAGFTEGFYSKPRIDKELLKKHSKGLIGLSACLSGEIPRALQEGNYKKAKAAAESYEEILGKGNFFLEVQNHAIPEEISEIPLLIRLSKETGIPLVATNDCHYIEKSDAMMQKVLMCIQMNRTIYEEGGLEFHNDEFYVKSGDEMAALFPEIPEALENTVKIADRCTVDFTFGETKLPYFKTPDGTNNEDYFKAKCEEGLLARYDGTPSQEAKDRLAYEMDIITSMGYIDYFLIVDDFVSYARRNGIPVGPGRGSGAGSLAAYCMQITDIDPLKYGLLFERFLNPERVTMPDFDIDFCYERRQEVIDYVVRKYGSDHVAQIVTFGTMLAKGAIRDVGRAMDIPYKSVDTVAKAVPFALGMTLKKAYEQSKDLRELVDGDPKIGELFAMAKRLEGTPRHASTHAAGVVITRDPVDEYVPLAKNDEAIVTQFTMTTLEELGLLKMDFLGLRTLTVIQDAEEMIQKKAPDFHIDQIPMDDPKVFSMLSKGNCLGVFQFESGGMRRVLENLKPDHFEDLIAVISLYRPGPMDSIPKYIWGRHHPDQVTYSHPSLESILNVTYGCIVYQEQVMEICRKLAGYSYGRADLVRRAMSKKKTDVMAQERDHFVYGMVLKDGTVECVGAVANGVDEKTANKIFDDMASFASYAFNKSHAAAYALLAYQTAYLKCYAPQAFFAALLTSVLDFTTKMTAYIVEAGKNGIEVLPPDINKSEMNFSEEGEGIRFGLLAVKNLGKGVIEGLCEERKENGPFLSFYDFCLRMDGRGLNRRALEGLIFAGAFDSFGNTRRQLYQYADLALQSAGALEKIRSSGQVNLFDMDGEEEDTFEMKPVEEFPAAEKLKKERETIGLYVSGHPLKDYEALGTQLQCDVLGEIIPQEGELSIYKDNQRVHTIVVITKVRKKITKSGQEMAFVQVEDLTGEMEVLFFPKVWEKYEYLVKEEKIIFLQAHVSLGEDTDTTLIGDLLTLPEEAKEQIPELRKKGSAKKVNASKNTSDEKEEKMESTKESKKSNQRPGLYLKVPSKESHNFEAVQRMLQVFEGDCPVYVYFAEEKQFTQAPKKLWVQLNRPLFEELQRLLGAWNVVYIKE